MNCVHQCLVIGVVDAIEEKSMNMWLLQEHPTVSILTNYLKSKVSAEGIDLVVFASGTEDGLVKIRSKKIGKDELKKVGYNQSGEPRDQQNALLSPFSVPQTAFPRTLIAKNFFGHLTRYLRSGPLQKVSSSFPPYYRTFGSTLDLNPSRMHAKFTSPERLSVETIDGFLATRNGLIISGPNLFFQGFINYWAGC